LLLQAPPRVASPSVILLPRHTVCGPVIVSGERLTLITAVAKQPDAVIVYVIFEVPTAMPVTMPSTESIVAAAVFELLHVPPPVKSLSVTVVPVHTEVGPVIATGRPATVIL
jgi:hypothetical protein